MRISMLPRLKFSAISHLLAAKPLEDLKLIHSIEKFLVGKRGYVFSAPKPGSPVILLHSGGMDSTIVCDILLRKFRYSVYPVYLKRGQRRVNEELRSLRTFTNFFAVQFPKLYHSPLILNAPIPPVEIRWPITAISNTPTGRNGQWNGIPMYSALLTSYAIQMSAYLEIMKNIHTRTIFCGFIPTDGEVMSYETLTAIRILTQQAIVLTNDATWQITSLPLEREIGYYLSKESLITWGSKHNIPIEKTWSCYWGGLFQCGECIGCSNRKSAFLKAGIIDKTKYKNNYRLYRLLNKISNLINV